MSAQKTSGKQKKKKVNALLVLPGDESLTTVVTVDKSTAFGSVLGPHVSIETWPYQYTRDKITGPNNTSYRLEMYVDESGLLKKLPINPCATLAMDPLGEIRRNLVHGPALILSADRNRPDLTMDDWNNICQGVYYDKQLVELNARGKFRM